MHFLENLKSRVKSLAEAAEATRQSIIALAVDDNVQEARLAICRECEYLFKPSMQCKKCGCFVQVKTSLAPFSCPAGKWYAITVHENHDTAA